MSASETASEEVIDTRISISAMGNGEGVGARTSRAACAPIRDGTTQKEFQYDQLQGNEESLIKGMERGGCFAWGPFSFGERERNEEEDDGENGKG